MPLVRRCNKAATSVVMLVTSLLNITPSGADTVQLNFNAFLVNGTCDFNLDKTHMNLGTILATEMGAYTLVNPQPFELEIKDCTIKGASNPIVRVSGQGEMLDKWVFRNLSSTAKNIGVMLVNSATLPSYASKALSPSDYVELTETSGNIDNQKLPFYAGLTCGDATQCSHARGGQVVASITFNLDFL